MDKKFQLPLALAGAVLLGVGGMWGVQHWQKQQQELADARAALSARDKMAQQAAAVTPEMSKSVLPPPPPPKPAEELADGKRFEYSYEPPQDEALAPVYGFFKKNDIFRQIPEIQLVDGAFDLPRPLKFISKECGQPNAFYSPEDGTLTLCYELFAFELMNGKKIYDENATEQGYSENFPLAFAVANVRFAMLHEFGHALINELKLPATGREEDVADQLAVTLMLLRQHDSQTSADISSTLRMAAHGFLLMAGEHTADKLADEHSLDEQRYFNIVCYLFGSDPSSYLGLVTGGKLPEARAARCQDESNKVVSAWNQLLAPHLSARLRAKAEAQAAKAKAQSQGSAADTAGALRQREQEAEQKQADSTQ